MTKSHQMIHFSDVPSDVHHSVFYYLLGRAHNVMPDHDPQAQSYLSSAVKLNPSYVEAWNELGNSDVHPKDLL